MINLTTINKIIFNSPISLILHITANKAKTKTLNIIIPLIHIHAIIILP
jgi:hypothetical protein